MARRNFSPRQTSNHFRSKTTSVTYHSSEKSRHTGEHRGATLWPQGDRTRSENPFSKWRKRTHCASVQLSRCSVRSKLGGSSTAVPWTSRDTRDRVGCLLAKFVFPVLFR